MENKYLIKYSEIGIKGKNRHIFEDMLVKNIKSALRGARLDGRYDVRKADGRIYVTTDADDAEETVNALVKVFGIAGIAPVAQFSRREMSEDTGEITTSVTADGITVASDFDIIREHVVSYVGETYEDRKFTFKVNCRRADKTYPMTSVDVNVLLGEAILKAYPDTHVDVHEPEVNIQVEIRPEDINIFSKVIPGPGGMPVGSSGRAMLLLSGGIDSPVAGYLVSKRGVALDAVYFHAPPYTSERAKQKVVDLAKIISAYAGPIRLHVINFTDIQMKIYEVCPHDELTIIMRRFMMKLAEHFAYERGDLGLITGESIGQVASQTMQSMMVTNAVCTMPVYRPLCGFDKLDIVDISERIGAYETSILPFEDCCTIFVAKHPVTKPRLDRIERSERKLDGKVEELYQAAIDTVEIIEIG